jgi:hypothetical protein
MGGAKQEISMTRKALPAAFLALFLASALASCGGGGGGPEGDPDTSGGPNKDKTSWGHYRGPGLWTKWYVSDSEVIRPEKPWYYKIQSAADGTIVAVYDAVKSEAAYDDPPGDVRTITLSRSGDSIYNCSRITGASGTVTDHPFAIAKIVGAEAEASGTAMQASASRALTGAANISLVLQNALNSLDEHTAITAASGDFSTIELIPGDAYRVSLLAGGSMGMVFVPENKADLGIVTKPAGSYTISCELESAGADLQYSPVYCYLGATANISALLSFSGAGQTEWAAWNFWRGDDPIGSASYFSLPTDGGYSSRTLQSSLAADFVSAGDFPAGADYVEIPLGLKGTSSAVFWEGRVTVRYFRQSFTLGTDGVAGSGMQHNATLITPDLRVHALRLEEFPSNITLPWMKGRYYIIIMGNGSYRLGPNVAFVGSGTPAYDRKETIANEPNFSRSLATKLDFGQTFEGSVGPFDSINGETNLDPVDYLYFDIP